MKRILCLAMITFSTMIFVLPATSSGTSFIAPTETNDSQELYLDIFQVQLVQFAHRGLDYGPLAVKGEWEDTSKDALRRYQAANNIQKSGVLDIDTACDLIEFGATNFGSAAQIPKWCN